MRRFDLKPHHLRKQTLNGQTMTIVAILSYAMALVLGVAFPYGNYFSGPSEASAPFDSTARKVYALHFQEPGESEIINLNYLGCDAVRNRRGRCSAKSEYFIIEKSAHNRKSFPQRRHDHRYVRLGAFCCRKHSQMHTQTTRTHDDLELDRHP